MLKYFAIISLFIIFISCSNEDSINSPIKDSSIIPLEVGNYWKYTITNFDTSGYAFNEYEWTNTIILDTTIENIKYYQFDYPNIFYNFTNDGFYQNYLHNDIIYKINYLYKYPCYLGERYWVNEKDSVYATIIAVNEEIKIQSTKYKCIVYDIISFPGDNKNIERVFIEPGIGIIMQILTKQTISGKEYISARFTLDEYNVNN